MVKDGVPVDIQAVGAGAVNQAVKAIAIARGFLSPVGIEIVCAPAFADIEIEGEDRTAIKFVVEPRYRRGLDTTAVKINAAEVEAYAANLKIIEDEESPVE
jgi:stage V sporulation protein S